MLGTLRMSSVCVVAEVFGRELGPPIGSECELEEIRCDGFEDVQGHESDARTGVEAEDEVDDAGGEEPERDSS